MWVISKKIRTETKAKYDKNNVFTLGRQKETGAFIIPSKDKISVSAPMLVAKWESKSHLLWLLLFPQKKAESGSFA